MTPERASEIVEELRGTCKSVDECLTDDEDAMDKVLCEAIDSELFLCAGCGWWFETGEAVGELQGEDACEHCVEDSERTD